MKFSRRTLLRGTALAPFVPLLADDVEAAEPRRRLVLIWSPDAPVPSLWDPTGTETNFTLAPAMEALEPFKSQLTIIKGLDKTPGRYAPGPGSGHAKAIASSFTAMALPRGDFDDFGLGGSKVLGWMDSASVDQLIAQRIHPKVQTPFKSIALGAFNGTPNPTRRISYQAPGQPVDPFQDPYKAFKAIFANAGVKGPEFERLRAERRSVLDLVQGQLGAVSTKVGRDDQEKIKAHLEAVRAVERRIQAGAAAATCEVNLPSGTLDPTKDANYPKIVDLHMDIIAAVFACDLTRVMTLQLSRAGGRIIHSWLGQTEEAHQDGHSSDAAANDRRHQRTKWYVSRFAYLLNKLKQIPEAGGSVLSNSVVAWNWELSGLPGAHQTMDNPWLLAGSAGGQLNTGRFLQFQNYPHSPLLVSLCNAMGLDDVQTFGRTDVPLQSGKIIPADAGGLPGLRS